MSDDRLVEADRLLEEGDPRGELIIVQNALEDGGFDRARGIALRRREKELLAAHRAEWAPDDEFVTKLVIRRGLVVGGTVTAANFEQHEEEIVFRYPHFAHLRLTELRCQTGPSPDPPPEARAAEPLIAQLSRVLAKGRITTLDLAEASVIRQTRRGDEILTNHHHAIDEVIAGIAGARGRLDGLFVSRPGSRTMASLLDGPPRFRELGFTSYGFDEVSGRALATTAQRPKRLTLIHGSRADRHAEILRSPLLEDVEDLTTSYKPRLFLEAKLPKLRVLRFAWGGPGREPMRALVASPLGRRLEAIELCGGSRGAGPALRPSDWDGVLL